MVIFFLFWEGAKPKPGRAEQGEQSVSIASDLWPI